MDREERGKQAPIVLAFETDSHTLVADLGLSLVQVEAETNEESVRPEARRVPKKSLAPPAVSRQNLGIWQLSAFLDTSGQQLLVEANFKRLPWAFGECAPGRGPVPAWVWVAVHMHAAE